MRKLTNKNKNLMNQFKETAPDKSFELVRTGSGIPTVRRNMGEGIYRFIHSSVDPEKEARIWNDCQNVHNGIVVILGCGLGYHVFEFLKRHKNTNKIYLIEADEFLFGVALETSDFSHVIDSTHIHLLIGQDIQSFEETLSQALTTQFSYHIFLPATALNPEFYTAVIRILDEQLLKISLNDKLDNDYGRDDLFATGVERLIDVMKST